ncbi:MULTISPECIES: sigma-54 interaction domain-containing protein [Thermodesulfovibrio]|uniref:Transcriptional regulator n=2 Tax=Thermodesulfovibrio yellowstonii TaxID=28262 RepID=B5YH04_THEYD|nr:MULTISPECIES: sigma-54-dependent Fis family transcriptional regulator [Thermodesulfovibrio]ACI21443.1 transcriptional regulator [Thermodesulfovibrio yellowstonii DSM 11347]GLI52928.1 sigma-54-dependent Fis family transcriptional regulator [Thermodesulfovibrio islandicus]
MTRHKNIELKALFEVSRVLTSSFDLAQNLYSVLEILSKELDMRRGSIFIFDKKTEEISIVAAYGLTQEEMSRGRYRIGEGIVGKVIETGLPMFIPDIEKEPQFLNKTGSRPNKKGISFLCVPIRIEDEILGVISADRIYAEEQGDVDDDLRVLSVVASLIGQFIKLWESYKIMEDENIILRAQLKDRYNFPNLVGQSPSFQAVLKTVMKVASTDATVLLFGESGTGKELIAKTIHFQSKRAKGPFVAINCAAIPENLLEAELFGSEKGAFTGAVKRIGKFEQANGGTIFLDEIAELPLSLQPKLLRVLQERTVEPLGSSKTIRVDVRLISATNKDLSEEIRKGNFREDLFWRLNVIPIYIPPLRERKEDIPLLVEYYLKSFCNIYRKSVSIDEEALKVLVSYDWPGNVRELANTIERLVVMTESSKIKVYDLPDTVRGVFKLKPYSLGDLKLPTEVEELERIRIMDTLPKFNFNIRKTAQALGLTERQLNYRIKKYGIIIKKGVNLHDSDN